MSHSTPYPNHALVTERSATIAMIVGFIEFTATAWYGSQWDQAHAFAVVYHPERRDEIAKSVMLVMDNYSINGIVSERTVENAWNIALDSVGIDHEALERERAAILDAERAESS